MIVNLYRLAFRGRKICWQVLENLACRHSVSSNRRIEWWGIRHCPWLSSSSITKDFSGATRSPLMSRSCGHVSFEEHQSRSQWWCRQQRSHDQDSHTKSIAEIHSTWSQAEANNRTTGECCLAVWLWWCCTSYSSQLNVLLTKREGTQLTGNTTWQRFLVSVQPPFYALTHLVSTVLVSLLWGMIMLSVFLPAY